GAIRERRRREMVDRDEKITREVWDRQEAIKHFSSIGEKYKAEIIQDLPGSDEITVYRQGNWKDLCRGPHLPSTKAVGKAFKLTKLAGAYWRGDHPHPKLPRIYRTAGGAGGGLEGSIPRPEGAQAGQHRTAGPATEP